MIFLWTFVCHGFFPPLRSDLRDMDQAKTCSISSKLNVTTWTTDKRIILYCALYRPVCEDEYVISIFTSQVNLIQDLLTGLVCGLAVLFLLRVGFRRRRFVSAVSRALRRRRSFSFPFVFDHAVRGLWWRAGRLALGRCRFLQQLTALLPPLGFLLDDHLRGET